MQDRVWKIPPPFPQTLYLVPTKPDLYLDDRSMCETMSDQFISLTPEMRDSSQPASFVERGVAAPFTTPTLCGGRVRPSSAARGGDVIVPNPSGARGVYVVPLASLSRYCTPTLHDQCLAKELNFLPVISPAAVRRIARGVALQGLAGRAARDAARIANQSEHDFQLLTNILLLRRLVDQDGEGDCPLDQLELRAKTAIRRVAHRLGRSNDMVTNDIESLAALYAISGTGKPNERARCPELIENITFLRGELVTWSASFGSDVSTAASMIVTAADLTLYAARKLLTANWEALADMPKLIGAWANHPNDCAARIARPEWLLDGWDQICLVWRLAAREITAQRRAVLEMALMVPPIPKELDLWLSAATSDAEIHRLRRFVWSYEDWRTGSMVFELIGRNEAIRAMAA